MCASPGFSMQVTKALAGAIVISILCNLADGRVWTDNTGKHKAEAELGALL